ncbi:MAG: L,D-transpeptidase [Planctomycetota bacterium]
MMWWSWLGRGMIALGRWPAQARQRGATGALLGTVVVLLGGAVVADDPRRDATLQLTRPRVVVLKSKRELHLFDGDRLVKTYPVALGQNPVGRKRCEGDGRTPEGRFPVVTKNRQSKYHRFLGLGYPDLAAVERGLVEGLISDGEARSIREALAAGRCPSWTTALGGAIGIHGHGAGMDWTAGCIALEDRHAEQLFEVLRIGDEVEILP